MKTFESITDLVGGTPLLRLGRYAEDKKPVAEIYGKLEYLNPTGSVKDRIAKAMIDDAGRSGALKTGSVIIEPTSGNTGIGLASACAVRGYRAIIVMPDTMTVERRLLMSAYGAEVVLTDGAEGMAGSIKKAEELAAAIPGSFIPDQFSNPANAEAHYLTTGPEIWDDTDGKIDIFVAGIGTGGTITGVGRYLKEKNPNIKIVGVEPAESPLLTKGVAGAHGIQGIGANFIPAVLDTDIYDEIIAVKTEDAYAAGRDVATCEGFLAGISSGAALYALFTPATAFSILTFTLLYPPCVAAIAAIKRELGSGLRAAGVSLLQCAIAWLCAFGVYALITLF